MADFNGQSPIQAANRLAAQELSLLKEVVKTLREEREKGSTAFTGGDKSSSGTLQRSEQQRDHSK